MTTLPLPPVHAARALSLHERLMAAADRAHAAAVAAAAADPDQGLRRFDETSEDYLDRLGRLADRQDVARAAQGAPVRARKRAPGVPVPGSHAWRVLEAYARADGLTQDEAARAVTGDGRGLWRRVSDLRTLGLIARTGATRPGVVYAHRTQAVHEITAAGRALLTQRVAS